MFDKNKNIRQAEIIAIGNEVVSGLILDSNSRFLSTRLQEAGVDVSRITSVGDDHEAIKDCLRTALERVDIVITTGGLGSTHDDITKNVWVDLFDTDLTLDAGALANLERILKSRDKSMTERFKQQAEIPSNSIPLYNEIGSAPGLLYNNEGKRLYALPGVPLEMKHLYDKYIHPQLAKENGGFIVHRLIKTTGVSESEIWNRIGGIEELEKTVTVASLPSYYGVNIRLSSIDPSLEKANNKLLSAENWLTPKLGDSVYAYDEETLEQTVGQLLLKRDFTLAVAESCTGGLIGHRLTQVPGSSTYFMEGITVYSNAAKMRLLNVPESILIAHGAVSEETAKAMAQGVRQNAGTHFGLSTTGIAGPGGGTDQKPVGLIYVGVSCKDRTYATRFLFHEDRTINKEKTAQAALNLLRLHLLQQ